MTRSFQPLAGRSFWWRRTFWALRGRWTEGRTRGEGGGPEPSRTEYVIGIGAERVASVFSCSVLQRCRAVLCCAVPCCATTGTETEAETETQRDTLCSGARCQPDQGASCASTPAPRDARGGFFFQARRAPRTARSLAARLARPRRCAPRLARKRLPRPAHSPPRARTRSTARLPHRTRKTRHGAAESCRENEHRCCFWLWLWCSRRARSTGSVVRGLVFARLWWTRGEGGTCGGLFGRAAKEFVWRARVLWRDLWTFGALVGHARGFGWSARRVQPRHAALGPSLVASPGPASPGRPSLGKASALGTWHACECASLRCAAPAPAPAPARDSGPEERLCNNAGALDNLPKNAESTNKLLARDPTESPIVGRSNNNAPAAPAPASALPPTAQRSTNKGFPEKSRALAHPLCYCYCPPPRTRAPPCSAGRS